MPDTRKQRRKRKERPESFPELGRLAMIFWDELDGWDDGRLRQLIRECESVTNVNTWFASFYLAPAAGKLARLVLENHEAKAKKEEG